MRVAALVVIAALIPVAVSAQQPADSSVRGDTSLLHSTRTDDNFDQYMIGARLSDVLVVRGEHVGLRVSPAAGTLGLVGRLRFRGPQTLFDDPLPLVVLDGMRLDAASGFLD